MWDSKRLVRYFRNTWTKISTTCTAPVRRESSSRRANLDILDKKELNTQNPRLLQLPLNQDTLLIIIHTWYLKPKTLSWSVI